MANKTEIIFEDKKLREWIGRLAINTKSVRDRAKKYSALISLIIFKDISEHFQDQEGSKGPWKEWSKSYQDAIAGIVAFRTINNRVIPFSGDGFKPPRQSGMILQDTGRLKGSFKPTSYRTTSEGIMWFNNAKTKSGFPYAAAHNEGGKILPKRDFMWLSEEGMSSIEDQTIKFILDE